MAEYIEGVSADLEGFNNGINDAVINLGYGLASSEPIDLDEINNQAYDPGLVPPDITIAEMHSKAKKVQMSYNPHGRQVCPCCQLPVEEQKIPLCYEVEKIPRLRTAYPLYFRFIKLSTILLALIFALNGFYNLVTNLAAKDCDPQDTEESDVYCRQGDFVQMTTANKRDHIGLLVAQLVLNFITIICLMFYFHYMRYKNKQFTVNRERDVLLPSKYTLKVKNVNPKDTDDDVIKFVRQKSGLPDLKVHQVHRPCKIAKVVEKFKRKRALTRRLVRLSQKHEKKKSLLATKLSMAQEELEMSKKSALKSTTALVIFDRVNDSKVVKKEIAKRRKLFSKKHVERAPEPTEILWENIGVSKKGKRKIRLFSMFLTIFLIGLSFAINTLITYGQIKVTEKYGNDSSLGEFLTILASVGILLTNVGLTFAMIGLSIFEKNSTTVGYLNMVGIRLTFAQLINTAFITIFSKLAIFGRINFYGVDGVLNEMFYVFLTTGFVLPLVRTFNIDWFVKLYQRWRIRKQGRKCKLQQREIMKIWEGTHFDLAYRYAIVLRTLFLTSFYASVMPIGIVISTFSMIALYWTDKYILFRRAVKPISVSNMLNTRMTQLYEWMALVYAVGNLVFTYTLRTSDGELSFGKGGQVLSIIMLFVSLLPTKSISHKIFKFEKQLDHFPHYWDAKHKFETTYELENPITRDDAVLSDFVVKIIGTALLKKTSCTNIMKKLVKPKSLRPSKSRSRSRVVRFQTNNNTPAKNAQLHEDEDNDLEEIKIDFNVNKRGEPSKVNISYTKHNDQHEEEKFDSFQNESDNSISNNYSQSRNPETSLDELEKIAERYEHKYEDIGPTLLRIPVNYSHKRATLLDVVGIDVEDLSNVDFDETSRRGDNDVLDGSMGAIIQGSGRQILGVSDVLNRNKQKKTKEKVETRQLDDLKIQDNENVEEEEDDDFSGEKSVHVDAIDFENMDMGMENVRDSVDENGASKNGEGQKSVANIGKSNGASRVDNGEDFKAEGKENVLDSAENEDDE